MVFRVPLDERNTSTRTELYNVFSYFTDRADMTSISPSGAFLAGDAHFLPTNHFTIIIE